LEIFFQEILDLKLPKNGTAQSKLNYSQAPLILLITSTSVDGLLMILQSLINFLLKLDIGDSELSKLWLQSKMFCMDHAPAFGLDDPSLFLAFGNPSTAKLYQVPDGKNFVLLRFQ